MRRLIYVLILFVYVISNQLSAKIYDCFIFFNELELLQIRLDELYDQVDFFVLVESTETFRGRPKPLYFAENRHLFEKYLDKILHVTITERLNSSNPWDIEHYQRDQVLRGLSNCSEDDIILLSDVDEVISEQGLKKMIELLPHAPYEIVRSAQMWYRYYLNRWDPPNSFEPTSIATYFKTFKKFGGSAIREEKSNPLHPVIKNSGWHFTSMGGPQRFVTKIENWSHHEHDREENKNLAKIRRETSGQFLVPIDSSYPRFVQEHLEKLKNQGLIDSCLDFPINQIKAFWPNWEKWTSKYQNPPSTPFPQYKEAPRLPYSVSGQIEPASLSFLEQYIQTNQPKIVVEQGAWLGLLTYCLALMLPENSLIYATDLWGEDTDRTDPRTKEAEEYFLSNILQSNIAHKVIPCKIDALTAAQKSLIDPDLVYLNSLQSPEKLYECILAWHNKISPTGLICGLHQNEENKKKAIQKASTDLSLTYQELGTFWYLTTRKPD